ncbi:MAG: IPT/TIG domain-containing protein [Prolixibacteraceae bacterium]|nr:IPT/TIG domain-containing protein [Prolixibacteraceae bacterium]
MKHNNIIYKLALLILMSAALFCSCIEEDTSAPVITNIRAVEPELADQSIEAAGLGQTIVIQGTGLETTQSVTLNGIEVVVNPAFTTNENVLISIPDVTPTVATHPDVANELFLTTEYGSISVPFTILPPPPVVESVSNLLPNEGDVITIKGKYFYFVESVVFPDNVVVTDGITVSTDGTSLTVAVPAGIGEGSVVVASESGTGSSTEAYRIGDKSGMLCNFDDVNTFAPWGPLPALADLSSNPIPAPLDGAYVRIESAGAVTPESWWNNDWVMPLAGVPDLGLTGLASDYALKFEAYVPEVWNSGWFECTFGWTYFYRWKMWEANPDLSGEYWGMTGERTDLITSDWMTVIIPLNLFRLKPDGAPDGDPLDVVETIMANEIIFAFQNPDAGNGGIELEKLHVCIDNLRIQKISE